MATSRKKIPAGKPTKGAKTSPRRTDSAEAAAQLYYPTKNDLPEATRREVIQLLNQRLAECIELQTHCKQAHWNVKGRDFIALHKLFDKINASIADYTDLIAERIVQLGGIAEGTVRIVAARSDLIDYPLVLTSGDEHVAALSDSLSGFGRSVRMGIEEMDDLDDAVTQDMLTEVTRGVDQWLWFVESHLVDRRPRG